MGLVTHWRLKPLDCVFKCEEKKCLKSGVNSQKYTVSKCVFLPCPTCSTIRLSSLRMCYRLWYLPGMDEWISGKANVWANVCVLEAGPDLQSGPWTWTWPGSHRELLPQSPAALPHHACPSQGIPGMGFRSWSSSPCLWNFLSLGKMVSADEVCHGLQTLIRNITVLFWRHLSSFFWKQEANLESV